MEVLFLDGKWTWPATNWHKRRRCGARRTSLTDALCFAVSAMELFVSRENYLVYRYISNCMDRVGIDTREREIEKQKAEGDSERRYVYQRNRLLGCKRKEGSRERSSLAKQEMVETKRAMDV